jgi:hypothetical protein
MYFSATDASSLWTFAASASSSTPLVNLNTTTYLVSTVLYVDEWCEVDFEACV